MKKVVSSLINLAARSPVGELFLRHSAETVMTHTREVEHGGVKLRFVTPNLLNAWRARSFSSKEPETLEWIDGFAQGSVVWDVGANVGLYSCYAARRRGCRVFAFEPSVFNLELLARNVFNNQVSSLVTLVPLPLSNAIADSTLNMTTTSWGGAMSTFDQSYSHDGKPLRKVFEFRTLGITMDAAVSALGLPQPDYLKMDVDGIEHLILSGGPGVLSRVRGVLIEVNEEFEKQAVDVAAALRSAGLELKEKRHSEIFDDTSYGRSFNQIWFRPANS